MIFLGEVGVGESGDGQLARFRVAQPAEGVEAAENVGVGLLLVALALVRRQPALAALGQPRRHLPARRVLHAQRNHQFWPCSCLSFSEASPLSIKSNNRVAIGQTR